MIPYTEVELKKDYEEISNKVNNRLVDDGLTGHELLEFEAYSFGAAMEIEQCLSNDFAEDTEYLYTEGVNVLEDLVEWFMGSDTLEYSSSRVRECIGYSENVKEVI